MKEKALPTYKFLMSGEFRVWGCRGKTYEWGWLRDWPVEAVGPHTAQVLAERHVLRVMSEKYHKDFERVHWIGGLNYVVLLPTRRERLLKWLHERLGRRDE